MASKKVCPACNHSHLLKIGVPGIRKCSSCGGFVDLRQQGWLQRLISV